ncbi:MAG: LysR family transcriptional regulator [Clostridia bacterium]|nr:LysR family transcriptional regulator [Clostridia bacterium]
MDLIQLKYFMAVAEYGNISLASEYLNVSQPTLSSAIKELEKEFGVTLFKRHHRGVALTEEGEILFKRGGELLIKAEETVNIMHDLGKKRKSLKLGVPPMIASLILPKIFEGFFEKNPDILPAIREGGGEELFAKLSEGSVDMIFVPHNRPVESGYSSIELNQMETVLCMSRENTLSKEKIIEASLLKDRELVLFNNSFFQTAEIKKWFANDGVTPNIFLQTEQLSTLFAIVSTTNSVGFAFKELVKEREDIVYKSLSPGLFSRVSLVWRKESYMSDTMKKFREFIKEM